VRSRLVLFAFLLASCEAAATAGAPCDHNDACGSPLVCRFGRCRTECVEQRDCPRGAVCLLDVNGLGSCALADDPDCSTGVACIAPLACVGRECLNVCTLGAECPAGSECVPIGDGRARCVRTDGVDAGLVDAGLVDAGLVDAARDAESADGTSQDAGSCAPPSCDRPAELALGDGFACVRTAAGRLWCWGSSTAIGRDGDTSGCDDTGTLSFACTIPRPMRAEDDSGHVADAVDVDAIDAQDTGGCYLTHGDVYCWGENSYDTALGRDVMNGARARSVQRATGGTLGGMSRVYVFQATAIAISGADAWFGWGNDLADELVLGAPMTTTFARALSPPIVAGATAFATGTHHACAIHAGRVICWGSNDRGESDPTAPSTTPVGPTTITGLATATQLVMGRAHSCALTTDGLACWGARETLWLDGDVGSCLAMDTECGPTIIPTPGLVIASLVPTRNIDDVCAIDGAGALWCWGNGYGVADTRPAPVDGVPPVSSAAIEWTHACAITRADEVWCWGLNERGELGRPPFVAMGGQPPAPVVWP
jgi:hypothetical protein